jgi:hypothetical protein
MTGKLVTIGDSNASNEIWGDTWAQILPRRFDMPGITSFNVGSGNGVYIEKLHYILRNNPDVELAVIQLTDPARAVTGWSTPNRSARWQDGELSNHRVIDDIGTYTWKSNNNDIWLSEYIGEQVNADAAVLPHMITSVYNDYKVFHDIITMHQICENFDVKCVFFSWFVDIFQPSVKGHYDWVNDRINIIPFVHCHDLGMQHEPDYHFGPESHEILCDHLVKEIAKFNPL